ncbi:DNA primase catalytic subunit PriS [Methanosphaerula subterraneus]|uniref:DNA primase catalytic subunit PriS n=1 Tax=Methanosphaerula subterraneus TaxID=3350244 RepID=UPI003F86EEC3
MRPATLEFIKQQFTGYYQRAYPVTPDALLQREWGFIFFDAGREVRMRRHLAFGERQELLEYLKTMVPAHVFYSSAYYESPGAPTMAEKGWSGADLIFDLDADHILHGPYAVMLARVKEETLKLLAVLTDELGFSEKHCEVVFSGGRGYHIHVNDLAVRSWGSAERREVVNYVCGIGLDPALLIRAGTDLSTGWPRRYLAALDGYLAWLKVKDQKEALSHLSSIKGVSRSSAAGLLKSLDQNRAALAGDHPEKVLGDRVLRAVTTNDNPDWKQWLQETGVQADEPVTTDIKRLIRMPTSLHGGSGLRVVPLTISEVQEFDPLVDAVVFGDRDVQVTAEKALTVSLLGSTYQVGAGTQTVPEAVAVFLCCRGLAEIAGGR